MGLGEQNHTIWTFGRSMRPTYYWEWPTQKLNLFLREISPFRVSKISWWCPCGRWTLFPMSRFPKKKGANKKDVINWNSWSSHRRFPPDSRRFVPTLVPTLSHSNPLTETFHVFSWNVELCPTIPTYDTPMCLSKPQKKCCWRSRDVLNFTHQCPKRPLRSGLSWFKLKD